MKMDFELKPCPFCGRILMQIPQIDLTKNSDLIEEILTVMKKPHNITFIPIEHKKGKWIDSEG